MIALRNDLMAGRAILKVSKGHPGAAASQRLHGFVLGIRVLQGKSGLPSVLDSNEPRRREGENGMLICRRGYRITLTVTEELSTQEGQRTANTGENRRSRAVAVATATVCLWFGDNLRSSVGR